MLLLRLPGLFLLRYAERALFRWLSQEPPRSTSGSPPSSASFPAGTASDKDQSHDRSSFSNDLSQPPISLPT